MFFFGVNGVRLDARLFAQRLVPRTIRAMTGKLRTLRQIWSSELSAGVACSARFLFPMPAK